MNSFHPLAILIVLLEIFVSVQFLSITKLLLINFTLLIIIILINQLNNFFKRINKLRWLILMIFITSSYYYRGDALFNIDWLPTYQGLYFSLVNILKLLPLIMLIVVYIHFYKLPDILSGFYFLIKYLPHKLQIIAQNLIIRIMLTLFLLESNFKITLNFKSIIEIFKVNKQSIVNNNQTKLLSNINPLNEEYSFSNFQFDINNVNKTKNICIKQYPWQVKDFILVCLSICFIIFFHII